MNKGTRDLLLFGGLAAVAYYFVTRASSGASTGMGAGGGAGGNAGGISYGTGSQGSMGNGGQNALSLTGTAGGATAGGGFTNFGGRNYYGQ